MDQDLFLKVFLANLRINMHYSCDLPSTNFQQDILIRFNSLANCFYKLTCRLIHDNVRSQFVYRRNSQEIIHEQNGPVLSSRYLHPTLFSFQQFNRVTPKRFSKLSEVSNKRLKGAESIILVHLLPNSIGLKASSKEADQRNMWM